ncbi:uncharacterized protein TrAFT101_010667 [Trichoderma asperellum]|uniref:Uncharacterized protein n=1 Tax=Trichoderma asperellum (strain ATCC 204424 / CBS 433.97 / NBRC 101777) TaxID=1042311 RepID=A0A2T3YTC0_TRIA4|nr:hypothetical protein M441DRAFT_93606 [Trichoderma asperellum CBS 433.97]PTB35818.1 hypothetical protein M441DRAFT_93606 [Trichoderma asperellum CBS 433.97]UKZ95853.1 hypothetical protein TrAFT101_010667 [Trichoderma asperellum]
MLRCWLAGYGGAAKKPSPFLLWIVHVSAMTLSRAPDRDIRREKGGRNFISTPPEYGLETDSVSHHPVFISHSHFIFGKRSNASPLGRLSVGNDTAKEEEQKEDEEEEAVRHVDLLMRLPHECWS